jgi:hypothetical protein
MHPADGAEAISLHVRLRCQKVISSPQVTERPVFRHAPHQFMSQVWIVSDFAAIQINRQRNVTLIGKLRGRLLDPVVPSPILMNYDERWQRTFAAGSVRGFP